MLLATRIPALTQRMLQATLEAAMTPQPSARTHRDTREAAPIEQRLIEYLGRQGYRVSRAA